MMPRMSKRTLRPDLLPKMDAYWRAVNYLSVGQIYLYDNPLLKKSLERAHIKPRLLGHWGTTPGLNRRSLHDKRIEHKQYIAEQGEDMPEIRKWKWRGLESDTTPNSA